MLAYALPHLATGALIRLLPDWFSDVGAVSLCYVAQKPLPVKIAVFVGFVVRAFREQNIARKLRADL